MAAAEAGSPSPTGREPRVIHVTLPADAWSHESQIFSAAYRQILQYLYEAAAHLRSKGIHVSVRLILTGTGTGHLVYRRLNGLRQDGSNLPIRSSPLPRRLRLTLLLNCMQWAEHLAREMEVNGNRAAVGTMPHPPGIPQSIHIPQPEAGAQSQKIAVSLRDFAERLRSIAKFILQPEQVQSQEDVLQGRYGERAWHAQCVPGLMPLFEDDDTWVNPTGDADRLPTWWRAPYERAIFSEGAVTEGHAWCLTVPPCANAMITAAQRNANEATVLEFPSEKRYRGAETAPPTPRQLDAEHIEWRQLDTALLSFAPPWTALELPIDTPEDVRRLKDVLDPPTKSASRALTFAGGASSSGFLQAVATWAERDCEAAARAPTVKSSQARHVYWHLFPAVPSETTPVPAVRFTDADAAWLRGIPAVTDANLYSVAIVPLAKETCPAAVTDVARALVYAPDRDVVYVSGTDTPEARAAARAVILNTIE